MPNNTPEAPSIRASILRSLSADKAKVWPSFKGKYLNRNSFLTASESNSCIRKLYYDKTQGHQYAIGEIPKYISKKHIKDLNTLPLGVLPDGWGYFERGHLVEEWLVRQLLNDKAGDWGYFALGDNQVSYHKGRLSGTPDGFAMHKKTGAIILLEFKSYDPRSNTRYFPKPDHKMQVQQNMFLVNELGIHENIDRAIVFYIDASNFKEHSQYEVAYEKSVGLYAKQKAYTLFSATCADDLEAEGMFNGGCKFCAHTSVCSSVVTAKKAASKEDAAKRKLGDKLFTSK